MTFSPGDVVTLKSGGQPLTVVGVDEDGIECIWIGDGGDLFRETIPAIALVEVEVYEDDEEESEDDDEEADDDEETSAKRKKSEVA